MRRSPHDVIRITRGDIDQINDAIEGVDRDRPIHVSVGEAIAWTVAASVLGWLLAMWQQASWITHTV